MTLCVDFQSLEKDKVFFLENNYSSWHTDLEYIFQVIKSLSSSEDQIVV